MASVEAIEVAPGSRREGERSEPTIGARCLEFLLVGGGTLVLWPLAVLLRRAVGLDAADLAVGFLAFHAATVINDPHFAVTYLLFYKDARRRAFGDVFSPVQRARYVWAALVCPLLLGGWAITAVTSRSARSLGLMIQLMFLLVGWHYVKQGFGVLTVLSARRGVTYSPLERRVLLGHCFAGWAYAWANPRDPGRELEEKGVVFTTFAHPTWLEPLALGAFLLSAVALLVVLARKIQREKRCPPLSPLIGLLCTIWLWTVYSSLDPLMVYVIPALHSLQYLYFVWLWKRNEARAQEGPPLFGRPTGLRLGVLLGSAIALGWLLFHAAPGSLDALLIPRRPTSEAALALGITPYFAAFFVVINLHHYFMDHVLWRRDNPETRWLREP